MPLLQPGPITPHERARLEAGCYVPWTVRAEGRPHNSDLAERTIPVSARKDRILLMN